ncbi:DMT family transporter [Streptomyces sp. NPDC017082]|uniref:DMT family transporter n=1 Tax=Streptomyces sp. NPDC017082 TaxID=3364974 RepID=UPI0037BD200F
MSALALSVLLSVVSALAYAGGAIAQEQVAGSSTGGVPVRRPGWWGALGLNGLGGLLHVVALACGPLSLVQPLGALTIVFALPMAALCVGRRAGATAWRGALLATAGLAGLLALVGTAAGHSLAPGQRPAVALVTGAAVTALTCTGLAAHRHPVVRSVLLATASGIAFGMSSVFTKTVAVDWSHGISLGDLSSLAAIGAFTVAGVVLSQISYRGGGLAAPLATQTVVNPVLAAVVGIVLFGETFRHGTAGTALALGCAAVTAGGLILLTTERLEGGEGTPPVTAVEAAAALGGAGGSGGAAPADADAAVPGTGTLVPGTPGAAAPGPGFVVVGPCLAVPEPGLAVPSPGFAVEAVRDAVGACPRVPRQRAAGLTMADRAGTAGAGDGTYRVRFAGTGTGGGTDGTGTAGAPATTFTAALPAAARVPVPPAARPYLPVPALLPVLLPMPVVLPAPCPRQMLTPPARR